MLGVNKITLPRQILQPRQIYRSPGLAKIAPWWLAAGTVSRLKYSMTQRRAAPPTFTTATAGPLAQIVFGGIGLAPPSIRHILTLNFSVIWTENHPATAPLTNPSNNHIFCIVRNLSAGQFGTIPAKTTCANQKSQVFIMLQY